MGLKGRRFAIMEKIQKEFQEALDIVTKDDYSFLEGVKHWDKCIPPQGEYFEE